MSTRVVETSACHSCCQSARTPSANAEVVFSIDVPRVGSGVVRIDQVSFLAGRRTRRLNQALSVLSLSLGFF